MPYVAELVKLKNGGNIGPIVREKVAHVLTGDATKVGFTRGGTELAQQQSQPFLEWFCTIAVPWLLRPANSIRRYPPLVVRCLIGCKAACVAIARRTKAIGCFAKLCSGGALSVWQ